jgi:hypothetical protein
LQVLKYADIAPTVENTKKAVFFPDRGFGRRKSEISAPVGTSYFNVEISIWNGKWKHLPNMYC